MQVVTNGSFIPVNSSSNNGGRGDMTGRTEMDRRMARELQEEMYADEDEDGEDEYGEEDGGDGDDDGELP